jgi:hypothetical protein
MDPFHHNPVRAKLVRRIGEYRYSGQGAYAEGRVSEVLEPGRVLQMMNRTDRVFVRLLAYCRASGLCEQS